MSDPNPPDEVTEPRGQPKLRWSWKKRILVTLAIAFGVMVVVGAATALGLYVHFSQGLPTSPR